MVNKVADRSTERARQDYVKVIYRLGQRKPVRAVDLARQLGVSRASVSKFKRMLERERLLQPARGRTGVLKLTKRGYELAIRMVRRHRLVETFLHVTLHVPLDRVHCEAERIEHAISDDVSSRLATFLNHPSADPHGHQIPDRLSADRPAATLSLNAVTRRESVMITSIDDDAAPVVRRLSKLGVLPGAHAVLLDGDEACLRLRLRNRIVTLPRRDAQAVYCVQLVRPRAA